MNVLLGCEESQAVCMAFRSKGHNAFSCDIQPASGGHPEYHIQGDLLKIANSTVQYSTVQYSTGAATVGFDYIFSTMHRPCCIWRQVV